MLPITRGGLRIAKSSGVNFDCMRAGSFCALDLCLHRIDEQTDLNAATLYGAYLVCYCGLMRHDVQPTRGGQLFPFLRHEAGVSRPQSLGKSHHCRGDGHLQIDFSFDIETQSFDIAVLNVPAVFTEGDSY